jgi:hypothetical protein
MYPTSYAAAVALAACIAAARAALIPAQYPAPVERDAAPEAVVTLTLATTEIVGTVTNVDVVTTSVDCVRAWCQDTSSLCLYWAGITGWNPSRGAIPGMTAVPFAPCDGTPKVPVTASVDMADAAPTFTM